LGVLFFLGLSSKNKFGRAFLILQHRIIPVRSWVQKVARRYYKGRKSLRLAAATLASITLVVYLERGERMFRQAYALEFATIREEEGRVRGQGNLVHTAPYCLAS
jgi:hypothetical protein